MVLWVLSQNDVTTIPQCLRKRKDKLRDWKPCSGHVQALTNLDTSAGQPSVEEGGREPWETGPSLSYPCTHECKAPAFSTLMQNLGIRILWIMIYCNTLRAQRRGSQSTHGSTSRFCQSLLHMALTLKRK